MLATVPAACSRGAAVCAATAWTGHSTQSNEKASRIPLMTQPSYPVLESAQTANKFRRYLNGAGRVHIVTQGAPNFVSANTPIFLVALKSHNEMALPSRCVTVLGILAKARLLTGCPLGRAQNRARLFAV